MSENKNTKSNKHANMADSQFTTNDIELMKRRYGYGDDRMLEWDFNPSDPSSRPMYSENDLSPEEELQFLADETGISPSNEDGLIILEVDRGIVEQFRSQTVQFNVFSIKRDENYIRTTLDALDAEWRKLMSHVGGSTLPGDLYGQSSMKYYAECSVDPELSTLIHAACNTGGSLSALWTPKTSGTTIMVFASFLEFEAFAIKYGLRIHRHELSRLELLKRNLGKGYGPGHYWHINFMKKGKNSHFFLVKGKLLQQLKYFKHLK